MRALVGATRSSYTVARRPDKQTRPARISIWAGAGANKSASRLLLVRATSGAQFHVRLHVRSPTGLGATLLISCAAERRYARGALATLARQLARADYMYIAAGSLGARVNSCSRRSQGRPVGEPRGRLVGAGAQSLGGGAADRRRVRRNWDRPWPGLGGAL